jgi:hypothetical protein
MTPADSSRGNFSSRVSAIGAPATKLRQLDIGSNIDTSIPRSLHLISMHLTFRLFNLILTLILCLKKISMRESVICGENSLFR